MGTNGRAAAVEVIRICESDLFFLTSSLYRNAGTESVDGLAWVLLYSFS